MYCVVRLYNEIVIELYRMVKVIVLNNFNRNIEECVFIFGLYYVVLIKMWIFLKNEKWKILYDLKILGISGFYLINFLGKIIISLVIIFIFIVYLSR